MHHGNIAVRIIEEFLRLHAELAVPVTRDTRLASSQHDYQLTLNVEFLDSSYKTDLTSVTGWRSWNCSKV